MRARRAAGAIWIVAGLFGLVLAAEAEAQTPFGDATRGKELAEKLCVNCHIVSDDAVPGVAKADVPPFAAIAATPGQTAERIAGRIVVPHPLMPEVPLTRHEMADIVAYIMSLKDER